MQKNKIIQLSDRNSVRNDAFFVMIAAFLMLLENFFFAQQNNRVLSLAVYSAAVALAAYKFVINGVFALLNKKLTDDLVITLAIVCAFATGYYITAVLTAVIFRFTAVVLCMINAASNRRYLQNEGVNLSYTVYKKDGTEKFLPAGQISPGSLILIRDGQILFADGTIVGGEQDGEPVAAGPVFYHGKAFQMRVSKAYDIAVRFEQACDGKRSGLERLLHTLAFWYTPVVFILAVLCAVVSIISGDLPTVWLHRAAVLLSAAGLSSFLKVLSKNVALAMSVCKKQGVVFQSIEQMHRLAQVRQTAFSKTGVLTKGVLTLAEVYTAEGVEQQQVLQLALLPQQHCTTAISAALQAAVTRQTDLTAENILFTRGRGVSYLCDGQQILCGSRIFLEQNGVSAAAFPEVSLYVAVGVRAIGAIRFTDTLRAESVKAVQLLRLHGVQSQVLTSDNAKTAQAVAEKCGAKGFCANLTPEEKRQQIAAWNSKEKCAFVGDSQTDEDALRAAYVGVAIPYDTQYNTIKDQHGVLAFARAFVTAAKSRQFLLLGAVLMAVVLAALLVLGYLDILDMWLIVLIKSVVVCFLSFGADSAISDSSAVQKGDRLNNV